MFHPERMVRAVVTCLKEDERAVTSTLQALKSVEIIDYREGDAGFDMGRPDPSAEDRSKKVIMLRTLIKELGLEDAEASPVPRAELVKDMTARMETMYGEISAALDAKEGTVAELKSLDQRVRDLAPFEALGLELGSYRGFRSLRVAVGTVEGDVSADVTKVSPDSYLYSTRARDGKLYLFAFVPLEDADAAMKVLVQAGYQEIPVPPGDGNPAALSRECASRSDRLERELDETERTVSTLKAKYKGIILASEELLTVEIERLEAPLRFAASRNAFIADLWVPGKYYDRVRGSVERASRGRAVCMLVEKEVEEEEPVVMSNPRVLSPFEAMVRLFSTPRYHEIDPTVIMSIFFPVFFGLMVSDVGFGVVLVIIGVLFIKGRTLGLESMASKPALRLIGNILLYGGTIGCILGAIVFGEMFGLPFKAEGEGGLAWNLPLLAPSLHIEKFRNIGDLLVLSLIFAGIHLGLGFVLGVVNNMRHNKMHALAKFGWLLILIGLVSLILVIASDLGNRVSSSVVAAVLFPMKTMTVPFGSISIPVASLALAIIGMPIIIVGEGWVAFIEVFTLVSNVFSYARIAAIGVAEAGVHFGFNQMLVPPMISAYNDMNAGSVVLLFLLALALFVAQLLVFVLGTFSAGIQSLRLHFFEFFTKFYEGGGREFAPFGRRLKYVKEV